MRPGVAGVFADAGGTWQAAGPPLPAGLGGDQVQVLGLTETAPTETAPTETAPTETALTEDR